MARPTIAALRAELDSLRRNCNLIETERDSLRAEVAALKAAAPVAAPSTRTRPVSTGLKRVFEFDPKVPGDFVRASKLAQEHGGSVRRVVSA